MDWMRLEKIEKKFDLFGIQTHPIPLNPYGLRANRTSPKWMVQCPSQAPRGRGTRPSPFSHQATLPTRCQSLQLSLSLLIFCFRPALMTTSLRRGERQGAISPIPYKTTLTRPTKGGRDRRRRGKENSPTAQNIHG
jgi:hypothetical protein